jgi:hypothetical protein
LLLFELQSVIICYISLFSDLNSLNIIDNDVVQAERGVNEERLLPKDRRGEEDELGCTLPPAG